MVTDPGACIQCDIDKFQHKPFEAYIAYMRNRPFPLANLHVFDKVHNIQNERTTIACFYGMSEKKTQIVCHKIYELL